MKELSLTLAGQTVVATAQHALVWPFAETLFVADIHFGKDATLRQADRWVPFGTTASDLSRLDHLIATYSIHRLVILGDAFHSEHAAEIQTSREIASWRAAHSSVEMLLVVGNHDRRARQLAAFVGFRVEEEGLVLGPWVLRHHPMEDPRGYVLSGHLHPQVTLSERGRQRLRVPCYFIRPAYCVLPAFGEFTGGAAVRPQKSDRVILVADEQLIEV